MDAVRNGKVDVEGVPCAEPGREIGAEETVAFFPNRPKARIVATRLRRSYTKISTSSSLTNLPAC